MNLKNTNDIIPKADQFINIKIQEEKQKLLNLKNFIKDSTMFCEPYEYEFIIEEPIIINKQNKKRIKKLRTYSNYKK